jgi:hypothetical protein
MPLPTSGPLGIDAIRNELGTSNGSLRALSAQVGYSSPDAISEFYGYSNVIIPFSYGSPRILFDFAAMGNYGNGITTIPDLSGNGNSGVFTVGTIGGSITPASGYAAVGNQAGYEFNQTPEYSIRSSQSRDFMTGFAPYSIAIWYFHRGWNGGYSYPGLDTFGGNFEWIISNDISGYRMWHRRGPGSYAFLNFSAQGQTYFLNQWHFAVVRYNNPTISVDWYNNSRVRTTITNSTASTFVSGGAFQIPLRFNNYLYSRVGYYSFWNYDIGTAGADAVFNGTRGRYGR